MLLLLPSRYSCDSSKISAWGQLILASAKSVTSVIEGDVPGFAESLAELGSALKSILTGSGGEMIKEYQEIGKTLARAEADLDTSAYCDEAVVDVIRKKLAAMEFI